MLKMLPASKFLKVWPIEKVDSEKIIVLTNYSKKIEDVKPVNKNLTFNKVASYVPPTT